MIASEMVARAVQAQHDWFDFPAHIGGERCVLHGLLGTLSYSRGRFVWISTHMTQLAWQTGHLALFQRYEGVPLWIRIDNLKTAVARGAGPTAALTPAFTTFARECGFAVDPCRAAMGSDKGKVERAERAVLHPVPGVHEPFDCVVARRVTRDALVSFESRRYSVPIAWIDRVVEVRGTAQHVVMLADGAEIARHDRHTAARLVLRSVIARSPPPCCRRLGDVSNPGRTGAGTVKDC